MRLSDGRSSDAVKMTVAGCRLKLGRPNNSVDAIERRYRRTGKASDKQAFATAAAEAYSSIRKSRADSFREQLAEAHGDQRATWRVANRFLHSKPPTYYSDDDCAHLSSTFIQF